MKLKENKLLPIAAIVVVALLGVVIYALSGSGDKTSKIASSGTKKQVDVDADISDDTIQTLSANVAGFKGELKNAQENNQELLKELKTLRQTVKKLSAKDKELTDKMLEMGVVDQEGNLNEEKLAEVEGRITENLQNTIDQMLKSLTSGQASGPVVKQEVQDEGVTRIRPMNLPIDNKGNIDPEFVKSFNESGLSVDVHREEGRLPTFGVSSTSGSSQNITVPRYTIPPNSILLDAVTVTSLIGRVPISGDVSDPAPFKVMIGSENLTANGFSIPNLSGMIISGTVFGDAVLSCAYANVNSATYIFEDGRSLSLPSDQSGSNNNKLGWLSDDHGNPCIPGKFITNAPKVGFWQTLIGAAAGAADAYATAETTATVDNGDVTSTVTGDSSRYVRGVAVSEGARNLAEYLQGRKVDQWDAVIVPAGTKVAFHVEKELAIDQSSNLRKIDYGNTVQAQFGLVD